MLVSLFLITINFSGPANQYWLSQERKSFILMDVYLEVAGGYE